MSTSRRNKRSLCLDRKLTAYTLAATAVVAFPHVVKADGITYVGNVHQTTTYTYDASTGTNNTTPDVFLTLPGAHTIDFSVTSLGSNASASTGTGILNASNGTPAALSLGALIDPTATVNFGTGGKLSDNTTFGKGNFPTNGEAYLGFYFTGTDGLHAGWADLTTTGQSSQSGTAVSLTLNSYAYNNVAGQAIQAGQTTAVTPEPASVSLIAMGAAGLAELRRRRRKYAEAA